MRKNKSFLDISLLILSYFLILLFSLTVNHFLKTNVSVFMITIISIILLSFGYLFIRFDKDDIFRRIKVLIVVLSLVLLVPFFMGKTYDLSCDGNTYHKPAVAYLKSGWNPIYESSDSFILKNKSVPKNGMGVWIDHYPKASWEIGASMYSITGNIESGKGFGPLLLISLLCVSYAFFYTKLKKWQAISLSILLSTTPVVLSQIFTFYVDGIMSILLTTQIIIMLMLSENKRSKNYNLWLMLASVIVMICNIKFTGLLFSGIFAFVFYIYWLLKAKKKNSLLKEFKRVTPLFAITYLFAVFFIGFSSYVKNFYDHGNPLYPLMGKGKIDIITTMQPKSFELASSAEKLFVSLYSKTGNVTHEDEIGPQLKVPFTVSKEELRDYSIPDLRIAGFGILFSGLFTIAIIVLITGAVRYFKQDRKKLEMMTVIVSGIVLSTIALGESWWARYAPQIYLLVIMSVYLLFDLSNQTKSQKRKPILFMVFACLFAIIFLVNNLIFIKFRNDDLKSYNMLETQLKELKDSESNKLAVVTANETGIYYNLLDRKIKYEIVDVSDDEEQFRFSYMWRVKVEK